MKKFLVYLLLVAAAIALVSCGTQTVKAEDYIEVKYSPAYNGYAKPTLVIDKVGLNALMDSKKTVNYLKSLLKSNDEYEELADGIVKALEEDSDAVPGFTDFFEIDFAENYEGLKNGDRVKVEISLDSSFAGVTNASAKEVAKKLGLNLSKTEFEVTVSGLEELNVVSVDLDKLLKVDFGKYNGYASPSVEVDYNYLDGLLVKEAVDDFAQRSKNDEVKELLSKYCAAWFSASFDEAYDGLKNGDEIKVNLVLDRAFTDAGISFEDFETGLALDLHGGTAVYKVEGLEDPKNVLDIFEDIEQYIVYEGANGNGRIGYGPVKIPDDYARQIGDLYLSKGGWMNAVKIIHNNTKIGEIIYNIDGENLSCGDVIELTATCPSNELEELGYIVPTTRKNTTVPDLGSYLTSQDQLTPEVIAAIKAEASAERDGDAVEKLYFATYKPGVECTFKSTSFIVAVVARDGWLRGYNADMLNDIIIRPDGSVVVESYERDNWAEDTVEEAVSETIDENKYSLVPIE